jgi:hypothetical protein
LKIKRLLVVVSLAFSTLLSPTLVSANENFGISFSPRTTNINANSLINVSANNLPTGQGMYALLCKAADVQGDVATVIAARPTLCDQTQAIWIVTGASGFIGTPGVVVGNGNLLAKANFDGKVTRMSAESTPVNCRVDECVIYTRPDHLSTANSAMYTVTSYSLLPASGLGLTDFALMSLEGAVVENSATPILTYGQRVNVSFESDSNLEVNIAALDSNCAVSGNQIRALFGRGECQLRATTLGDETYAELNQVFTFQLKRAVQEIQVNWPSRFGYMTNEKLVIKKNAIRGSFDSFTNLRTLSSDVCSVTRSPKAFEITFMKKGFCKLVAVSAKSEGRWTAAREQHRLVVLR